MKNCSELGKGIKVYVREGVDSVERWVRESPFFIILLVDARTLFIWRLGGVLNIDFFLL